MTAPLASLTAALADRYRIERQLGAGGMATVYLAYDIRHERNVALKVLRPELAAVIGADRFLAEIKTTAHLQHAHILGLIDSGTVGGTVFYAMPFVEGESLRDRLDREKQLPIADAVRIAVAVAGALDYAHRRGVIHRDIKPANILLHEGQPYIADFGIALAATRTETSSARMTETGMSLGTPQYMSPEQAMGERALDGRTDIYSLGCVLYEMLTGEPPFSGPTAQGIIAKIMAVDPQPVTTLRPSVPANVAAATMTALSKVPADRFATAAEFSAALTNPHYGPNLAAPRRTAQQPSRVGAGPATLAVALAAALVLATIVAIIGWMRSPPPNPSPVARFQVELPAAAASSPFVLSPDGSRLLWAGTDGYYERRLDSLAVRRLRESAVPQSAIRGVSPDGREVLVGGRGGMAVVPLASGPALTLPSNGRGGMWASDGNVYFAFGGPPGSPRGVGRVSSRGGVVDTVALTTPNEFPLDVIVLPGAKAVIVVLNEQTTTTLAAFDLDRHRWHPLGIAGNAVQYVAPGYLVYSNGQYLMAAPFDVKKLAVTQPSVPIAEAPGGSVERFAVGGNVLAYLATPDPFNIPGMEMRSRSRSVKALPNLPDSVLFSTFTMSPDGARVAAVGTPRPATGASPFAQGVSNIYVLEIASGRLSRWRSELRETNPSWIPGGRDIAFTRISSDSPATATLMRRPWDASADAVPIHAPAPLAGGRGGSPFGVASWFPDGKRALLAVARTASGRGSTNAFAGGRGPRGNDQQGGVASDLRMLILGTPDSLPVFVSNEFTVGGPAVSPDGRFVAYTSNESGRTEVYVRPVSGGALRQVSLAGGTQPKWARSGREIFFRNADTLFAAPIDTRSDLSVERVTPMLVGANLASGYAVGTGDSTFIMRTAPSIASQTTASVVVVLNVAAELRRIFNTAATRPSP